VTLRGSPDLTWASLFAPDRFTSVFLRDIDTVSRDLHGLLGHARGEFYASSFALVFLCAASLMLLRLTRWPLLNLMLLGIAVRGWFSLYHLLAVRLAPQIAQAVADPLAARAAPAAAFLALGVLFLLVDVLFLPAHPPGSEPAP
jgi:hypothetical protein